MKSENGLRGHSGAALLLAFAAFSLCAPVAANTLDAKTLSGLVSGHTWQSKWGGAGYLYWAWNSDGTVCVRQEMSGSSCTDTGRWKLVGDSVCHEFSWWGKSTGFNARCYRVAGKGEGHYEMIPVDGVTTFDFQILK